MTTFSGSSWKMRMLMSHRHGHGLILTLPLRCWNWDLSGQATFFLICFLQFRWAHVNYCHFKVTEITFSLQHVYLMNWPLSVCNLALFMNLDLQCSWGLICVPLCAVSKKDREGKACTCSSLKGLSDSKSALMAFIDWAWYASVSGLVLSQASAAFLFRNWECGVQ